MAYSRLGRSAEGPHQTWSHQSSPYGHSANIGEGEEMRNFAYSSQSQAPIYGSETAKTGIQVTESPYPSKRTNSGFSVKLGAPAWQHDLTEKHTRRRPTDTDTVRYFDRSRQTRRVLISSLKAWSFSVIICGAIAATLVFYSRIRPGLTQTEKYSFNALILVFSIFLGIAFSAEFKHHCEMIRWRFLASTYRTLDEFEDVLGCDSWRSTMRLMFKGRKGQWYPTKAQVLALAWLVIYIILNVVAGLVGLTMSIDVSDTEVMLKSGNSSVVNLAYIAHTAAREGEAVPSTIQESTANLWGQVGQAFPVVNASASRQQKSLDEPVIFYDPEAKNYGYHFIDQGKQKSESRSKRKTGRTITSTATCEEYEITFGGYAGTGSDDFFVEWTDNEGTRQRQRIETAASSSTTWMGNSSSNCGDRCSQILALQSANNLTVEEGVEDGISGVPVPRMFGCNNTLSQVTLPEQPEFDAPEKLLMPDMQAQLLARAIGLTGIVDDSDLQYSIIQGDFTYSPPGNNSAADIANLVMRFTMGAIAAMDQRGAPRQELMGNAQPNPAQIVEVKWKYAIAILAGMPTAQLLILIAVVHYSGKAIIREPSALTTAHLLYPVIQRLGHKGVLLSVDEITEKMGPDFKVAYTVRPNPRDPGHYDKDFVRDLGLVEQREGFGYIRGNAPEGRID